jgi:stage II sporulation protein D
MNRSSAGLTGIVAITALLSLFTGKTALNTENWLYLEEARVVSVQLFSSGMPGVIRLNAVNEPLLITAGKHEQRLSPGDGFIYIHFENGTLRLQQGEDQVRADRIRIQNPDGEIQTFSREYGHRFYHGDFDIRPANSWNGTHHIINRVGLEQYVASVIGGEMNFRSPEALKTQAVITRTYTLWNIKKSSWDGFHLRDDEQNQVYPGILKSRPDYAEAAEATRGEILTWSDKLVLAAYSSTCGGVTGNNEEVWDGAPHPYLRSTRDHQMCSISPHYRWEAELSKSSLQRFIRQRYGLRYDRMKTETDNSGRVSAITFTDRRQHVLEFNGNEFRRILNRYFDEADLKSTFFTIEETEGSYEISGRGLGHGVGLCQWGAKGFAREGWNYRDILAFYFSGTKVVDLNHIEEQKIALSN